uniref:Uncharacterized protein n=1 Tax=Podoviridae sp. ctZkC8 TaxID=2825259 RepID=A0A8S5UBL2_9CAUD|nr:MAG TPA: hypothetical protein [Podoviridae sp. ctZkC8]
MPNCSLFSFLEFSINLIIFILSNQFKYSE